MDKPTIKLTCNNPTLKGKVQLPASKSISNRLLIMNALASGTIHIKNLSTANDTEVLKRELEKFSANETAFNAEDAGTAFRFLSAFIALKGIACTLTGSNRMLERPVGPLVEVLNELGAAIKHSKKHGYPPLHFHEAQLKGGTVNLKADMSSQFISSLLLIAPYLKGGCTINLQGEMVSEPYINMTMDLMESFGVTTDFHDYQVSVKEGKYGSKEITVENDWSAASYFYSALALAEKGAIQLNGLRQNSIQGDTVLVQWFKNFGIETEFTEQGVLLSKKSKTVQKKHIEFDCTNNPDLAQTLACTCVGLGVNATITGLQTLPLKETNRLTALKTELEKFGVSAQIKNQHTLVIISPTKLKTPSYSVETYNDHRMAMSFAPLVLKTRELEISNPQVVKKSFPNFWDEVNTLSY